MRHLRSLGFGANVAPVCAELDAHPELWNRFTLRTRLYGTPHLQVSDIWCRYRAWSELLEARAQYPAGELTEEVDRQLIAEWAGGEHESLWYEAIDALPALRAMVFDLARRFEVERLGGVLVTRIPPGGRVEWHTDGGWHANYYEKVAVLLRADERQAFCFHDGEFRAAAGTVFTFNNQEPHAVSNESSHERITAIICVKRDARRPRLVNERS